MFTRLFSHLALISLLLISVSCLSPRMRQRAAAEEKRNEEKVSQAAAEATPQSADNILKAAVTAEGVKETASPLDNHALAHAAPTSVSPQVALGWLKNGNKRFVKGWFRKDGKTAKDRVKLADGQKPHTIILSCSDSRVPPEHVFDQALGEVFSIRVAGEAIDSSVLASIEYAAMHLGTRLVLVMGHTQCGAVSATLTAGRTPAASTSLGKLVADIGPRVQNSSTEGARSPDLYKESFDNAKGVAADLTARSEILKSLVANGQLKIATAIYNLKTGAVDFAD